MGSVLAVLVWGFFVGSLARWAVPGPDPMPIWLTMLIGVLGAALGGGVMIAIVGKDEPTGNELFAISISSIVAAALLVVAYRRFIQKRPITGPEARRLPTRGIGVARMRQRLRAMGIDPDRFHEPGRGLEAIRPGPRTAIRDPKEESLRKLRELREEGLLSDEEYEQKKAEVEARED
jgi:uncharacterized membrane protein YeaQ/YmgE (transglycosylase-associated protein family)